MRYIIVDEPDEREYVVALKRGEVSESLVRDIIGEDVELRETGYHGIKMFVGKDAQRLQSNARLNEIASRDAPGKDGRIYGTAVLCKSKEGATIGISADEVEKLVGSSPDEFYQNDEYYTESQIVKLRYAERSEKDAEG